MNCGMSLQESRNDRSNPATTRKELNYGIASSPSRSLRPVLKFTTKYCFNKIAEET